MQSDYLRTLVESIATGSFSKTADKMCITQSAVSRRIKFLEDQYGYSLIDRSGPLLTATEAGRIVLEKAERMLRLEEELHQDLRALAPRQGITFCCTPSFGVAYLPKIMNDFVRMNTGMSEMKFFFDMPDKVIDGLRKGLYQAGVIEHNEVFDLTSFEACELPGDDVVFVSSPKLGHIAREVTVEQLIGYDLYTRKEGCCSSNLLECNMKKLNRDFSDFSRIFFYDDLHMIISSVLDGNGIAFISRSVVDNYLKDGRLREHRVVGFDHSYRRTLVMNSTYVSCPVLGSFVSCINSAFSQNTCPVGTTEYSSACDILHQ